MSIPDQKRQGETYCTSRSYRLVEGAWWRTFGIYLLASIIAATVSRDGLFRAQTPQAFRADVLRAVARARVVHAVADDGVP